MAAVIQETYSVGRSPVENLKDTPSPLTQFISGITGGTEKIKNIHV